MKRRNERKSWIAALLLVIAQGPLAADELSNLETELHRDVFEQLKVNVESLYRQELVVEPHRAWSTTSGDNGASAGTPAAGNALPGFIRVVHEPDEEEFPL